MLVNDQIVKRALCTCDSIENNDIAVTTQVSIRSHIGFVSCSNVTCLERISFINRLANMKHEDVERVTGMCKNRILIKYNTSYFHSYKSINVIVIPKFLMSQWDTKVSEIGEDSSIMLVKGENDIYKLRDFDFSTLVISANMIEEFTIWFKLSGNLTVNKIILDACDDIVLPSHLNINYNFMWILGYGFIEEYIRDNYRLHAKGFLKSIVEELFSSFALDISRHLIVELKGNQDFKSMKYLIESKKKPYNDIVDALNHEDVCYVINYINPTIFNDKEKAHMYLFSNLSSTINHLDTHISSIDGSGSNDRKRELHLKKIRYQDNYDTSINRMNSVDTCNICIDDIKNETILKCCKNSFCLMCINKWFQINDRCPICKKKINIYKDQILISSDVDIKISQQLGHTNSVYENFIILMQELREQKTIIIYNNPVVKGLLQGYDISHQTLRVYNKVKSKSNIVITTKSFLGCGMEYVFDNLIVFEKLSEILETKLYSIFNPRNVWILFEN